MIFETERLLVRKLEVSDIEGFFELQSNPNVMQYATGNVQSREAIEFELKDLISKYSDSKNDFWIYAVALKTNNEFIGTVAFVKDGKDDEIGYRIIERCWGLGYGNEICGGMVCYAKARCIPKLVGYVVDVNKASAKILVNNGFTAVHKFVSDDINLPETKYEIIL
ncbi:GNAT family N-acetyltransferase [Tenacibaculum geojense]|uniref:GNAT family N-acetyltransferase n=1 Tax=Tenacibaculum geojense TaxID=915352 RepID=A0ABW3JRC5_9FLAO